MSQGMKSKVGGDGRMRARGLRMRHAVALVPRYAVLTFLGLVWLVPFFIIVRNAGMSQAQILSPSFTWVPSSFLYLPNLNAVFADPVANMIGGLMTSTVVTVGSVTFAISFGSLAGYGLARITSRWARPIFYLVVITLTIPSVTLFVPRYLLVAQLGWLNTYQGLAVPYLFSAFDVFLFRQFFLEFPRELEEAAKIDGLSDFGIFWRIVVPNSLPIFLTLTVLTSLESWNSFLWPLVVGSSSSLWTVQIVLSSFLTSQVVILPEVFMAGLVAIIPVLIVFGVLQRYLVEGFKRSGIVG